MHYQIHHPFPSSPYPDMTHPNPTFINHPTGAFLARPQPQYPSCYPQPAGSPSSASSSSYDCPIPDTPLAELQATSVQFYSNYGLAYTAQEMVPYAGEQDAMYDFQSSQESSIVPMALAWPPQKKQQLPPQQPQHPYQNIIMQQHNYQDQIPHQPHTDLDHIRGANYPAPRPIHPTPTTHLYQQTTTNRYDPPPEWGPSSASSSSTTAQPQQLQLQMQMHSHSHAQGYGAAMPVKEEDLTMYDSANQFGNGCVPQNRLFSSGSGSSSHSHPPVAVSYPVLGPYYDPPVESERVQYVHPAEVSREDEARRSMGGFGNDECCAIERRESIGSEPATVELSPVGDEGEDADAEGEDDDDEDEDDDTSFKFEEDDRDGDFVLRRGRRSGVEDGNSRSLRLRSSTRAPARYIPYMYTSSAGSPTASISIRSSSRRATSTSDTSSADFASGQHSESPSRKIRPSALLPVPVPVPNLTKKSRGRRVPTVLSVESRRRGEYEGSVKKSGKGSRTYTCKVAGCGKCFARGEHLKRHVRSIHTYEKPHKCPYPGCGKDFSRHDNLGQHMRVHKDYIAVDPSMGIYSFGRL